MITHSSYNNIPDRIKSILTSTLHHSRPAFLIIGTQKGGTTALFNYLWQHPNIVRPRSKEIGYFDQDILYRRGLSWYHSHFPLSYRLGRRRVTFEATPEYLYYPKVAERLFSYDRRLKLIVLLRDPVYRAFSAWNMFRRLHRDRREYLRGILPECDPHLQEAIKTMLSRKIFQGFDDAVLDEVKALQSNDPVLEPGYVARGLYYVQINRYCQYFERNQLLIIESGRLMSDTVRVLDEITQFLRLPKYSWQKSDLAPAFVGDYQIEISNKSREFLREFYKPFNQKLYEWLGADFEW